MEEKHTIKCNGHELSVRMLFEHDGIKQYDIDVISNTLITANEFIDIFMDKIRQAKTGRIGYIDGSEETMEDAQRGRMVCTWLDDYMTEYKHRHILKLPIRFASLQYEYTQGSDQENLILFVPNERNI